MGTTTGKERQRQPQRLGTAAARTLAGLCLGLGMYGVIHGLKAEEGTLRLTLSAITLCCGLVLLLRTRHTAPRYEEENVNR
ncbi:hypothetical protein [uncultured Alistipes sp.]|mgnify:CR=1 FL=1|uniref:hypothetical protein n=1 Tax=uncultured Alistipes sp. TaxID=538949 RepID=UPI002804334C|nr:hypothetical protein [uncultured Alistipes sp.]